MRILHVTPYAAGAWAYGGIPRVVDAVVRGLARRGHDVTVCATDACDAHARLPPAGDAHERIFRNASNALAYHWQFFAPLGMRGWLEREARTFDVAHVHACHHLPGAWASRALARAGVPYVLQPHGTAPRIERRRAAKWLFDHTVGRGVLERAARVLAVSRAEARTLAALGVAAARLRVVPNPVALTPPATRGAREWPELVVYLGKLTPRKRLDVLIDAFASLARPSAGLVIAGNDMGVRRALEAQVAALGLGARVRFTGLVRADERLELLAGADVVAYAAEHEVFGLVVVEAVLCGTPVVVADDSGAAELVREHGGGRVVAAGSAPALAAALRELLDGRDRSRALAADARARFAAAFDPARVCAELEAIYAELSGKR
jgi:glycosyltransferase involved in cell wall biosynthesis